jgi:transposase
LDAGGEAADCGRELRGTAPGIGDGVAPWLVAGPVVLQADAYAGFNRLYEAGRKPCPLIEAACWAHARRKFYVLADVTAKARGKLTVLAPLALDAVKRIDAIFALESQINGLTADERLAVRHAWLAPLVSDLEVWMRTERARLSRHAEVAKAMDYMLKRWTAFTRGLDEGRIYLTNNAAERALRGIALGRKSWLFAGSDRGGERAAVIYTLIQTAKLNDVDPQVWLADVLARINDHTIHKLTQLLPWNWKAEPAKLAA